MPIIEFCRWNEGDWRNIFVMSARGGNLLKETPMRTPMSGRPYLTGRLLATPGTQLRLQSLSEYEGQIYGTNIEPRKVMGDLQRFVLNFEAGVLVEDEIVMERIYSNQLNELAMDMVPSLLFEVNSAHLHEFDPHLYLEFVYFPAEMISCFDAVLRELFQRFFVEPETNEATRVQRMIKRELILVSLKRLRHEEQHTLRELGPQHIGRLVSLQGIVIRMSEIHPEMKRAHFRCGKCKATVEIDLENARVREPSRCEQCRQEQTFELIHNMCLFTDKQYVKFQELPDFVREGETPSSVSVIAYDTNVDGFRPGDRVELVGIYRANAVKLDRAKFNVRTVFNTYIDLLSFNMLQERKSRIREGAIKFTDDERRSFAKMAEGKEVIKQLINSFAPSIFGNEEVKLGILTQLFGGTVKDWGRSQRGHTRADINICLVGDPSTAKSQLLQQVHKIAPRCIYTSGRGSSAVGLTANVRKDPETREFVLESGALVLSDRGICCIDEFDKMDQNSRLILLQAMEQQTISIAKAGIVCQLNSRTAILAAANPIGSKYDNKKSVVQNIDLTPALLSRFDLIYIMLDLPNEVHDRKLALHILEIYSNKPPSSLNQGPFPQDLLAKYITYAREYVRPALTEQAGRKLAIEYKTMRERGLSRHTISATPRQLESLIRLSEAIAKMQLKEYVTEEDVEEAIELMKVATLRSATDPVTGRIDFDIITTGRSQAAKQKVQIVAKKLSAMLTANQAKYRKTTSLSQIEEDYNKIAGQEAAATRPEIHEALKLLETEDLLKLFGPNKTNPSFKLQRTAEL